MKANKYKVPSLFARIYGIWYRHMKVYTNNLFSNGLPPFMEPLIFLAGIGLGLGKYISEMDGIPYITFLASGLFVTSAMFTSSFECTYGTFIRMNFDKAYDGILSAPVSFYNLMIGEILWAGTKGFFFSFAVLVIIRVFGIITNPLSLLAPTVGFLTGIMFSVLALLVTSVVKNINHFNFFFTGFLSPMFFFSGVVFPIKNLPEFIQPIVEFVPLTHSVRLVRAFCLPGNWKISLVYDFLYIIIFTLVVGFFALKRLRTKMIH